MSLGHSVLFKLRRRASENTPSQIRLDMVTFWSWMGVPNWSMSTLRRLNWRDLGLILRSVGYHSTLGPVHLQA